MAFARRFRGQHDVLATIVDGNLTDKVTRGEVITFLSRYQIPDDEDRQELYSGAIDRLLNTKLLTMFLARQQLPVSPEKIDEQIEQLKQDLKKDGQDLATALVQNGISLDDIRKEYENRHSLAGVSQARMPPRPRFASTPASTATSSAARRFVPATS